MDKMRNDGYDIARDVNKSIAKQDQELYDTISKYGYNQDFATFRRRVATESGYRKRVYDSVAKAGFNVGFGFDEWNNDHVLDHDFTLNRVKQAEKPIKDWVDDPVQGSSVGQVGQVGQVGRGEEYKTADKAVLDLLKPNSDVVRINNQLKKLDTDERSVLDSDEYKKWRRSYDSNPFNSPSLYGLRIPREDRKDSEREFPKLASIRRQRQELEKQLQTIKSAEGKDDVWYKKLGRGAWNAATTVGTWDMGMGELEDIAGVKRILNKIKVGKPLEDYEIDELSTLAASTFVNSEYGKDISSWEKIGGGVVESVPFMLEMFVWGMMSGGTGSFGAAAKKVGGNQAKKILLESLGKEGYKKLLQSTSGKILKGLGKGALRVGGDVLQGVAMANTTGSMRTAADAIDRNMGVAMPELDADGNIHYGGHEGGVGLGEAIFKAEAAQSIEYVSEMAGEYFEPLGKLVGKGFNKLPANRLTNSIRRGVRKASNSGAVRYSRELGNAVHFNSPVGETAEEYVGGLMNALIVGDQTLDADPETGLFTREMFNQTVGVTGVTSLLFLGIGGVRYGGVRAKVHHQLKASDKAGKEVFGEEWDGIKKSIEGRSLEELNDYYNYVEANAESEEQSDVIQRYVRAYLADVGTQIGGALGIKEEVNEQLDGTRREMQVRLSESDKNGERLFGGAWGDVKADIEGRSLEELDDLYNHAERYTQVEGGADAIREYILAYKTAEANNVNAKREGPVSDKSDKSDESDRSDVAGGEEMGVPAGEAIDVPAGEDIGVPAGETIGVPTTEVSGVAGGDDGGLDAIEAASMDPAVVGEAAFNTDGYRAGVRSEVVSELGGEEAVHNGAVTTVGIKGLYGDFTLVGGDFKVTSNERGGLELEGNRDGVVYYRDRDGAVKPTLLGDIGDVKSSVDVETEVSARIEAAREAYRAANDIASEQSDAAQAVDVDLNGNAIDSEGRLVVDQINSIDDLTDDDFDNPSRSVELPRLPKEVDEAIGANGKPVVIKKNIFERNSARHNELSGEDSRRIISEALYNPDLYGQNQKVSRPNNWVLIHKAKTNESILLEVNRGKDNVEIVHWHYLDDRGIEKIKRQASREGGQILMLPSASGEVEEAGALSSRTASLSQGKGSENVGDTKSDPSREVTDREAYRVNNDIASEQSDVFGDTDATESVNRDGFALNSSGGIDFGEVTSEMGLPAAPIRMNENSLEHIESRHGDEIRGAGFNDTREFVEYVSSNFTRIKEGTNAEGSPNGTYLLQVEGKHNDTLYVEFTIGGGYWNVNSGGVFNGRYGDNKRTIWSASVGQNKASEPLNTSPSTEQGRTTADATRAVSISSTQGKGSENAGDIKSDPSREVTDRGDQVTDPARVVGGRDYKGDEKSGSEQVNEGVVDNVGQGVTEEVPGEQAMLGALEELEGRFGVQITVHRDASSIRERSVREAIEAGDTVKGWYNTRDRSVHVYLPQGEGVSDITATYLHEVVAHYGMRELLGEEKYNSFLETLWGKLDAEERSAAMMAANMEGMSADELSLADIRLACDEYVASIAERGDFDGKDRATWRKMVDAMLEFLGEFLDKLGVSDRDAVSIVEDLLSMSARNLERTSDKGKTRTNERVGTEVASDSRVKVREDGSKDYVGAGVEATIDDLFMETGHDTDVVDSAVQAGISEAEVKVKEAEADFEKRKKKVKGVQGVIALANERKATMSKLEGEVKFWQEVWDRLHPKEEDRGITEGANTEINLGEGNPIYDRWAAAKKVEGKEDYMILPNGERIEGRFVMVEADAMTPSHSSETMQPSEGFPMTSDGRSVNDNDYSDKRAIVTLMAQKYDKRALDHPVVVSDGFVISGNNRTMSGQMSARMGHDGEYLSYLRENASKWGFSPEAMDGFSHARVVFVPNERIEPTTKNMAKFNRTDVKQKSPSAKIKELVAIGDERLSRVVADATEGMERIGELYDGKHGEQVTKIFDYLVEHGFISQAELPQFFNRAEGYVEGSGKELLEGIALAPFVDGLRVSELFSSGMTSVRNKVIGVLPQLLQALEYQRKGKLLGVDFGFDIQQEMNRVARHLFQYQLNYDKDFKSVFVAQSPIFDDVMPEAISYASGSITLMLMDSSISEARESLNALNKAMARDVSFAERGGTDMFGEGSATAYGVFEDMERKYMERAGDDPKEQHERATIYNYIRRSDKLYRDAVERLGGNASNAAQSDGVANEGIRKDVQFRRAINEANSKQKQEGGTKVELDDDVLFRLTKRGKSSVDSWLKKREDLTNEEREAFMQYLEPMDNNLAMATGWWYAKGVIRVPEDQSKVDEAVEVARRAKVDPMRYGSPMEVLDTFKEYKIKGEAIDPESVPQLSNGRNVGDVSYGIRVYDVEDSKAGQQAMREIINTHWGEDANPWCLLQGDGNGNLSSDAWQYWNHYNGVSKRVAFKDGKLFAFCANDNNSDRWWDRQDDPHDGIPVDMKMPNDELGREATYDMNEDGTFDNPTNIHKGNKQNGVYEEWFDEKQLWRRINYKNGKRNGLREVWHFNGQLKVRENYKDGKLDGLQEEWYPDGELKSRDNYKNGELDGLCETWDINGKIRTRGNYKDGVFDGLYERWYPNGALRYRENYKNNTKAGVSEEWYENGVLKLRENFRDGFKSGLKEEWYENGQLRVRSNWKNNSLDGLYEEWDQSGNLTVRSIYKGYELVEDLTDDVRFRRNSEELEGIKRRAVAEGRFMKAPNGEATKLNEEQWLRVRSRAFKDWFGDWELPHQEVKVVEAAPHQFKNFNEAKSWAKENIARVYSDEDTGGKGEIRISRNAIDKYLSQSAIHNSSSEEVHLSVLKVLPDVIKSGIDAEQHFDYNKSGDGVRSPEFGINKGVIIHRVYSAVELSGELYRVKVTLKMYDDLNTPGKPHSYEAIKIELLKGTLVDTKSTNPSNSNSISVAKLLKDVEKSYEKGKYLLDDYSKMVDENGEPMVFYHNTDADFTVFDSDKNGTHTDAGWLGDGFYFYGEPSEGDSYGKNKMATYLNIREPYYASSEENSRLAEADDRAESIAFREQLEGDGYDGVYYDGDLRKEAVVFNANQIKSATDNVGSFSGESDDIRFRRGRDIEAVNERFNEELEDQIAGKQQAGHVYQLGMPSDVLRSAGVPDLPIELAASRLKAKSEQANHPFDMEALKGLPIALSEPIAVFDYGDGKKSQNIIVNLESGGKNFLVGIFFNQHNGSVEVNSIRGLFPKDMEEWLNWATQGKMRYVDKEKVLNLIGQRRINLADVTYLDLGLATKVVKDFDNPKLEGSDVRFRRGRDIEAVNERFNEELEEHIAGKQQAGHVYQLGMPSDVLRSAGVPDLPIEVTAKRLVEKSLQDNHQFDISDLSNLPIALSKPIAVFNYGDGKKSQNVIVDLESGGKNFLVGIFFNQAQRGVEVNDIRGLFPKDMAEWLNWATQGKMRYVDKEKVLNLISQRRTNLAEVTYLDLGLATKVVKDFDNPKLEGSDVRFRRGRDIEAVNERFNEELEEHIAGKQQAGHVYQLGMPSDVLRSAGVPDLPIELAARTLNIKSQTSWHKFNLSLVRDLPRSIQMPIMVFDSHTVAGSKVVLTELKDGDNNFVAVLKVSEGLGSMLVNDIRSVYPKDHIQGVIDWINAGNLLRYADKEKTLDWLNSQHSYRTGTETPIKGFVSATKIVKDFDNPKLEGSDVRFRKTGDELKKREEEGLGEYAERMQRYHEANGRIGEASRVGEKPIYRGGSIGEYAREVTAYNDDPRVLLRGVGSVRIPEAPEVTSKMSIADVAKEMNDYHHRVREVNKRLEEDMRKCRSVSGRFKYNFVDRAAALETFNESMRASGIEVPPELDAYSDMMRSAGMSNIQLDKARFDVLNPMEEELSRHSEEINKSDTFKGLRLEFRDKETGELLEGGDEAVSAFRIEGLYLQALDIIEAEELGLVGRGRSGFSDGVVLDGKSVTPEEFVELYEGVVGSEMATELQAKVKNSTDYILDICRAGGLIGEEAYQEYRSGRKHYVPQRSWEKRRVSGLSVSDVLDRVASGSVFNPAVIEAKGRESLASNPLPFIANILQSSIFGMRANATKQKMLEWVERNYKELSDMGVVGLRRVYYVAKTDPISGDPVRNDAGEVVYEMTTSAPSSEMLEKDAATRKSIKEVKKEISDLKKELKSGKIEEEAYDERIDELEGRLKELEDSIVVKFRGGDAPIEDVLTGGEKARNTVKVLRDGVEYQLQFNSRYGGDLVADVLNRNWATKAAGDNAIMRAMGKVTRKMSSLMTQYKPSFASANLIRDFGFASISNLADYGVGYQARFMKNMARVSGAVARYVATDEAKRTAIDGEDGVLSGYLREYFDLGSQTGWSYLPSVEELGKEMKRAVDPTTMQKVGDGVIWTSDKVKAGLSWLTEVSELTTRFAAYVTARETMNKDGNPRWSKEECAMMSKELTTNFDRRGAMSGVLGSMYGFFNASVQGTNALYRLAKRNKAKVAGAISVMTILGFIQALLQPDDDDDDATLLPFSEWDMMTNLCIGDYKIPLPHGFRGFWGFGTQLGLYVRGEKSLTDAVYNGLNFIANSLTPEQVSNALEALCSYNEMTGELGPDAIKLTRLLPTATLPLIEVWTNRDFRGMPISRNPYSTRDEASDMAPDVAMSKGQTSEFMTAIARGLFELAGGDPDSGTRMKRDGSGMVPWWLDHNPSKMEHLWDGYTGVGRVVLDAMDFAVRLKDGEKTPISWRDTQFAKPFIKRKVKDFKLSEHEMLNVSRQNGYLKELLRKVKDPQLMEEMQAPLNWGMGLEQAYDWAMDNGTYAQKVYLQKLMSDSVLKGYEDGNLSGDAALRIGKELSRNYRVKVMK